MRKEQQGFKLLKKENEELSGKRKQDEGDGKRKTDE